MEHSKSEIRAFDRERVPRPKDFRPLDLPPGLHVEIGCGVGLHPIRWALENVDRKLIAFERTEEKFRKFQGRLHHHPKIENVIPVRGCGVAWLAHLASPESVEKIFLLYPNPYPKESQRNLRWHQMPAMAILREVLRGGGRMEIATNEEWYFQEAKDWLVNRWGFYVDSAGLVNPAMPPRTHFEKKYLGRGEQCWNLVVSKPC